MTSSADFSPPTGLAASLTLRPLGMGELLDAAFALYRKLFGPLVALQIVCGVPTLAVNLYNSASGGTNVGLRMLGVILSLVLGTFGAAATALLIGEAYLGRSIGAKEALVRVLPYLRPLLVASLLLGLLAGISAAPTLIAVGAGMAMMGSGATGNVLAAAGLMLAGLAALVLPLWIFAGTSLATIALVLESGLSGAGALRRSWALTAGARGRIMALFLLLIVVLVAIVAAVGVTLTAVSSAPPTEPSVGVELFQALLGFVLQPIIYCVLTLIYYDRRVRREGFDLELLSQSLA